MLYFLLIHKHKQLPPATNHQSTQTEPLSNSDEKALESTIDTLIKNIQQLNHQLK